MMVNASQTNHHPTIASKKTHKGKVSAQMSQNFHPGEISFPFLIR